MTRIPLSQWADAQGIPRRTAYNWAKSGALGVPVQRTLSGRLMVLVDDEAEDAGAGDRAGGVEVHPFVAAYAEALAVPVGDHTGDIYYSPVLEAWGTNLYKAVDADLRPVVLHLALAAACHRRKQDVLWRIADWLGRVELADLYADAAPAIPGLEEAAAMVRARPEITDDDTWRHYWPTGVGSFDWRDELEAVVRRHLKAAGVDGRGVDGAADILAENGLPDNAPFAIRRDKFRLLLDRHARTHRDDRTVVVHGPDRHDLWDLRALYGDIMFALARPEARRTARTLCELVGWDPDGPSPADGHPLRELGYPTCLRASYAALTPYVHAAHVREMDAFRRIALGKPFAATGTVHQLHAVPEES